MIRTPEEMSTMTEVNQKLIDKSVRVIEGDDSWVGKVIEVVDHETFSVKRNKASEAKNVSMFDIRSL